MNYELAEALINFEEHDEVDFFKDVTEETIIGKNRWSIHYEMVFQDSRDETYWRITWWRGATESQDDGAVNIRFSKVEPKNVTVTQWVEVK